MILDLPVFNGNKIRFDAYPHCGAGLQGDIQQYDLIWIFGCRRDSDLRSQGDLIPENWSESN